MRLPSIALISVSGFNCESDVQSVLPELLFSGSEEEELRIQPLASSHFPREHSQKTGLSEHQFT